MGINANRKTAIALASTFALGVGAGFELDNERSAAPIPKTVPDMDAASPANPAPVAHIRVGEADNTTYIRGKRIDEIYNDGNIAYKETLWSCIGSSLIKLTVQLKAVEPNKSTTKADTDTHTQIFREHSYCIDNQITAADFKRGTPPESNGPTGPSGSLS